MKKKVASILLFLFSVITQSQAYRTEGGGEYYSFYRLSQTEGSGVTMTIKDGTKHYTLSQNDTISAGDFFDGTESCIVYLADNVTFVIKGKADFQTKGMATYAALDNSQTAVGICLDNTESTPFGGCTFVGVGVKFKDKSCGELHGCTFNDNNCAIGQAALILGDGDGEYLISHCRFQNNKKAAISSAANIYSKMVIEHSEFLQNGTANGNTPQLNLTASSKIVINNCNIVGDTTHTMVGGIGISNFMSVENTDITISNTNVMKNRYGIGTVGPMNVRITGNYIIDNCYETNPMNGGSGISLYDPYMKTCAVMTGNYIKGSLWGVTVIGCKDVNLGCLDEGEHYNRGGNVFEANGNNGQLYDLYNNSSITVYAQNNTWNVSQQTEEQIETVIFHKNDDPSLGEVIYMPAANTTSIAGMHTNAQNTNIYDLYGRQTKASSKGIYIVNGKKVVR